MSTNVYPLWSSLVLLLVILAIPLTLWLVKRVPGIQGARGGNLTITESLSVGPRERLLVVHTGTEYLLMGTTGQQITLIKELDNYQPVQDAGTTFAGAFQRALESRSTKAGGVGK